MGTWKKILVEGDAATDNLGTANLSATESVRTFSLADGASLFSFKDDDANDLFSIVVTASNAATTSLSGGMQVIEDGASPANQGCLKLYAADSSSEYVCLMADGSATGSQTITFPAAGPTGANQILESDASGNLSWIATPSGSGSVSIDNYSAQGEMLVAGDSSSNIDAESNVTFSSSTLTVTGRIACSDLITLSTNNRALKGKTTTAEVRDLIKINTDDSTVLGNTSEKTILSGTSVDAGSLQFNCGQATMDQIIETNISLNHSSTSAGHGDGSMVTYFDTSGSNNTTSGRVYYYTGTAWAFATSSAEAGNKALVGVALGDTEASGFLLRGFVNAGATMTAGSPCFLSANASITTTAPTSGFSRIMGHSVTTTVMYFNPSAEYLDLV